MAPHAEVDEHNNPPSTAGTATNIVRLPAPERPAFSASPPRLLIIGAGNRGNAYAKAVEESSNGVVVAVVEPVAFKRRLLGRKHIWGAGGKPAEGQEFEDWRDFVTWELRRRDRVAAVARGSSEDRDVPEGVDAVFICVQDAMHKEVVLGLAPLNLHIMCEKPLCPTLGDCLAIYKSLLPDPTIPPPKLFSVGHVLRYSPHNMLLRKLLVEDRVVGEVMAVNHTEPVGWDHFTHSYVRGNWRNEKTAAPSLLAKCCHDIDILYWLLATPPPGSPSAEPRHVPKDISSSGSLQYFTKAHKPPQAGSATNCLTCPHEPDCQFSAKRIYTDPALKDRQQEHFACLAAPEMEDFLIAGDVAGARAALMSRLAEDYDAATSKPEDVAARTWYGRCVYESDNDVCDNQTVTLSWDGDESHEQSTPAERRWRGRKTATLHMMAFTAKICLRFTHIYGVKGEIYADSSSITVTDFMTGKKTVHYPHVPEGGGHGDGDAGLVRQFVLAVDRVKNHGQDVAAAQREHIGCDLRDVIMTHAMVFAAEEARTGKAVVDFPSWWEREVVAKLKV